MDGEPPRFSWVDPDKGYKILGFWAKYTKTEMIYQ